MTDSVHRIELSSVIPNNIQTIKTIINNKKDFLSSINVSSQSYFVITFNCSDYLLQNIIYSNNSYNSTISLVRTDQINVRASAKFVQNEVTKLLKTCANEYQIFSGFSDPSSQVFSSISLHVVRRDVRSNLGIANQNICEWEISFFSELRSDDFFPDLIVENNLLINSPISVRNFTNPTSVILEVRKKEVNFLTGIFQLYINGEKTNPISTNNTKQEIITIITQLSTVNYVDINIIKSYTNNQYSNKKRMNIIYEITFFNQKNWAPTGFNFFMNGVNSITKNNDKNEKIEGNGKYDKNFISENGLWRPAFGAVPLIIVETSELLGYSVSSSVTIIKIGQVKPDIMNIILTDLTQNTDLGSETIFVSSLNIFVLPTEDPPQVRKFYFIYLFIFFVNFCSICPVHFEVFF